MGEESLIRVLVADDHPMFREGVARNLAGRPELNLVGEVDNGPAALAAIDELAPEVSVLDLKLPGLSGIEVTARLLREKSPTRVIILSAFSESAFVYEALAAGAAAYVSKDETGDVLYRTVVAVAAGETVLPDGFHAGIAAEIRRHSAADNAGLTAREVEILVLAADGLTMSATAKELFISAATVKSHLRNIYAKLGVSDRAAAVAEAMRSGVLS